jgi:hypothetical protein
MDIGIFLVYIYGDMKERKRNCLLQRKIWLLSFFGVYRIRKDTLYESCMTIHSKYQDVTSVLSLWEIQDTLFASCEHGWKTLDD